MKLIPCHKCNSNGKTSDVCTCDEGSNSASLAGSIAECSGVVSRSDRWKAEGEAIDRSIADLNRKIRNIEILGWHINQMFKDSDEDHIIVTRESVEKYFYF